MEPRACWIHVYELVDYASGLGEIESTGPPVVGPCKFKSGSSPGIMNRTALQRFLLLLLVTFVTL